MKRGENIRVQGVPQERQSSGGYSKRRVVGDHHIHSAVGHTIQIAVEPQEANRVRPFLTR
jgi:hypothetical protein